MTLEIKVKIDTIKLGDKIGDKIESTVANSELLEPFMSKLSYEEKREFYDCINQAVHGVVCHFDNLSGVMS